MEPALGLSRFWGPGRFKLVEEFVSTIYFLILAGFTSEGRAATLSNGVFILEFDILI